jgi:hypothetical protein
MICWSRPSGQLIYRRQAVEEALPDGSQTLTNPQKRNGNGKRLLEAVLKEKTTLV